MSTETKPRRSYTTLNRNLFSAIGDFIRLLQGSVKKDKDLQPYVKSIIENVRQAEQLVLDRTGVKLQDMDVLEVGTGQLPRQIGYFSQANRVIGIDLDRIVSGFDVPAYWEMLRNNGVKRLLKTIGRKALGFDRRYSREMARQLGVKRLGGYELRQMDATKMSFDEGAFGCVYSFDVFEHLPEPEATIKEMKRVLKPGGIGLTSLHPFTAEDGNHDLSIISGNRSHVPYWAHLRPDKTNETKASAYLNKISLSDWHAMFERVMPGAHFVHTEPEELDQLKPQLATLREAGELEAYSDEELLVRRLVVIWQKP